MLGERPVRSARIPQIKQPNPTEEINEHQSCTGRSA